MKKIILFCSTALFALSGAAQLDSVFFYDHNGNQRWYYVQKDVYSFRLQNGQEYEDPNIDMNVVDRKYHQTGGQRKLNVVEFKNTSLEPGREIEKNRARNKPNFECEFLVLSEEKDASKDEGKWVTSDDILIVSFHDPHISQSQVQAFANRNDLLISHSPSNQLDDNYKWSYLFKVKNNKCLLKNTIDIAKEIYENEHNILDYVYPNLSTVKFESCTPVNEMSLDTWQVDKFWHIRNNGQNIFNGRTGLAGADADICDCWGEGYYGQGVKVGVLDGHNFQFEHEDLQGQILPGWDLSSGSPQPMNNTVYLSTTQAHGTAMASIIAAKGNNNIGIVGVAPESKIVPYLMTTTASQIPLGIQQAVLDDVDILNMSLTNGANILFLNDYQSATATGRKDPWDESISRGLVIVAGAGNSDRSDIPFYPGALEYTIGVGASNPDDKRANIGDNWPEVWNAGSPGSNYGAFYDVVAPGSFIQIADAMGANGFVAGNYAISGGTSASTAIVSGLVAIIISKNPSLSWQEIKDIIIHGAAKVHTDIYNYNYDTNDPGRSFDMQYGRVSCINSLQSTPLSTKELVKDETNLYIYDFQEGLTTVLFSELKKSNCQIVIRDLSGKEIHKAKLSIEDKEYTFNSSLLSHGMYIVSLELNNTILKSMKYVK